MIERKKERSGTVMTEDETTAQPELNSAAPPSEADQREWDPDEHWEKLKKRGLVRGERPDPAKRVKTSEMRPIRYLGTNEDLLRDLGRCP